MSMTFSSEQNELRSSVRRFLEQKSSSAEVRRLMETDEGYDPAVWTQMAEQLGLQGLTSPRSTAARASRFVELGIVLEEMGRALLCAPYFSTVVLAANAILNAGTDDAEEGAAARHRERRDDRDARVHRAERQVGRVGHHDRGARVGRRLHARPARRCSCSTATPRT